MFALSSTRGGVQLPASSLMTCVCVLVCAPAVDTRPSVHMLMSANGSRAMTWRIEAAVAALRPASNLTSDSGDAWDAELGRLLASTPNPRDLLIVMTKHPQLNPASLGMLKKVLEKGAAIVSWRYGPPLEELNLSQGDVRSYVLWPDDAGGGALVGDHICKRFRLPKRIALFVRGPDFYLHDIRVNGTVGRIAELCPDVGHSVVHVEYTQPSVDPTELMKAVFIARPDIDAVIAGKDSLAISAVDAAREVRPGGTAGLLVTGFGNFPEVRPYLQNNAIACTVDHRCTYKTDGLLYTLLRIIPVIQASPDRPVIPGLPNLITTPVKLLTADMGDQMMDLALTGYNKNELPGGLVHVRAGLGHATVMDLDTADGVFRIVTKISAQWIDGRLAWDKNLYSGGAVVSADRLWLPQIYVANSFHVDQLRPPSVEVAPSGEVSYSIVLSVGALCHNEMRLFPFDRPDCQLNLSTPFSASHVSLDASLGFSVADGPKGFSVKALAGKERGTADGRSIATFRMYFERNTSSYFVMLIIPSLVLNMIGFVSFWISDVENSFGVSMTTLLSTLVMRQSMNLPTHAGMTWMEAFLLENLVTQCIVSALIGAQYLPKLRHSLDAAFVPLKGALRRVRSRVFRKAAPRQDAEIELAQMGGQDTGAAPSSESARPSTPAERSKGILLFGRYIVIPCYMASTVVLFATPWFS